MQELFQVTVSGCYKSEIANIFIHGFNKRNTNAEVKYLPSLMLRNTTSLAVNIKIGHIGTYLIKVIPISFKTTYKL